MSQSSVDSLLPPVPASAAPIVLTNGADSEVARDLTPAQLAEARYLAALGKLVDDASTSERLEILADALAWTLARLMVGCGLGAAADILRRVGGYVGDLLSRREAQEEAERARREGHAPH